MTNVKMTIEEIAKQHKFCFICAGVLEYKEKNLLICTKCGYHKYINPVPCNGALLKNSKGEILLIERRIDPMKGYWDFPGGFVDLDENIEESMARELKEETDLTIVDLKYFCSEYDIYTYDGITFPTLGSIFTGTIPDGQEITVHDDVASYKFFEPSKLPFDKLAFKSVEKALKTLIAENAIDL
ncbi:MAG TPA: NUDIX domain-containing protein [Patescibacteria group bacterium]|nr:NUDIX domain-containing protein [Patescibacteria group bacterium]